MDIKLEPHNQKAYEKMQEKFKTSNKTSLIHPTGTRKTNPALKWALEDPHDKVLYLVPSKAIRYQTRKTMHLFGIKTKPSNKRIKGISSKKQKNKYHSNIEIMTYAKLARLSKEEMEKMKFNKVIFDEFQFCGAPVYGRSVNELMENNPQAKYLGITATPIRYLDKGRDMVEELFDGNVASEMTLEEAIAQGILMDENYITALYGGSESLKILARKIEKCETPEKKEEAEKLYKTLQGKLDKNTRNLPEILAKYTEKKNAKGIVYCKNIQDMEEKIAQAKEIFGKMNPNIEIYTVSSREEDAKKIEKTLQEFENNNNPDTLKLVFAVNMLNLGYHIKDLDIVVMFRPTMSPSVWIQQVGRGMTVKSSETENEQKVTVFDFADNFEMIRFMGDFRERVEKEQKKRKREGKEVHSILTICDETREFREIVDKINELTTRTIISTEEKLQILEQFYNTEKEIYSDSTFNGYPIGKWQVQLRSQFKKNGVENLTQEQLTIAKKLRLLERAIDSTTDEKIQSIIEWKNKYPKLSINRGLEIAEYFHEIAQDEEEYKSLMEEYAKIQNYYRYINSRNSGGKLSEKQKNELKEAGVNYNIYGYPKNIEETSEKLQISKEKAKEIINEFGTLKNMTDFIKRIQTMSYEEIQKDDNIHKVEIIKTILKYNLLTAIDIRNSEYAENYKKLMSDLYGMI